MDNNTAIANQVTSNIITFALSAVAAYFLFTWSGFWGLVLAVVVGLVIYVAVRVVVWVVRELYNGIKVNVTATSLKDDLEYFKESIPSMKAIKKAIKTILWGLLALVISLVLVSLFFVAIGK